MSDVGRAVRQPAPVDPRFARPRTLFFGIGAQKSGTSWLSDFLAGHPETYMSPRKELHYWNVVRPPHDRFPLRRRDRDRVAARKVAGQVGVIGKLLAGAEARRAAARQQAYADIYDSAEAPFAHYADALFSDYAGEPVAGEFTPAYARLSLDTLGEMAALAPDVRFVFVMRAPVARLVSGVRHRLRLEVGAGRVTTRAVETRVRKALRGDAPDDLERSRYDLTIERLDGVAPPERVFLAFYETLFTEAEIERLCRFLGVAPHPADFGRRVNVGDDRVAGIAPDLMEDACRVLAPVHAFVARRMGPLPQAWLDEMEG